MSTSTPSAAHPGAALLSREQLQQRYIQNKAELTSHVSTAAGAEFRMLSYGGDSPIFYYDAPVGAEVHSGLEHQTVPDEKAKSVVQGVMSRFENRRFSWVTGPPEQARLEAALVANDFTLDQKEPVMAVDLTHQMQDMTPDHAISMPLPKGMAIETVSSRRSVENWVKIWTHNAPEADTAQWTKIYGNLMGYLSAKQFHMFAAKNEDGTTIGTGYIHYYAGVAAIHAIFVTPQFRGLGIGKAMTAYAMRCAKKSNYNTAMLTASSLGMRIFTSLGFQEFGTVKLYVWRPLANLGIIEQQRLDKERAAQERLETDRLERAARRNLKLEKRRLEREQFEKEQLEEQQIQIANIAKELEMQKLENDRLEREKTELQQAVESLNLKAEKERVEKQKMDELEKSERLLSEETRRELQKTKKTILHQERLKQAKLEEMRIKTEQAEKQKEAAERLAAQLKKDAQAAQDALEAEQDGWCIV